MTPTNCTDISTCTDAVLDIYLRTIGGEDGIDCDALTVTERGQLADLMGWERTPFLAHWIADAPAAPVDVAGLAYEGRILARQGY